MTMSRSSRRLWPRARNAFLLPLLLSVVAAAPAAPVVTTVVLVVRHAERAPGTGDVPLSETGQARAAALAAIGKDAGVQVIIHTQLLRSRQTAEPLAGALGILPVVVSTQSDLTRHAAEVAAAVRLNAGKTVLVVGHSNTVTPIVSALGGTRYPDLCDAEYDALFTLVIDSEGSVRTVRTRFGAPTPLDAGCGGMR